MQIPSEVRLRLAKLAAEIIEMAAAHGEDHWGVTPFPDGFRVNVGWTEILTAMPEGIRLVVDGEGARSADVPAGVELVEGVGDSGFYPSVPGSVLALIPYEPSWMFEAAVESLGSAWGAAVRLAARRKAGGGVRKGHSQEMVDTLSRLVGRRLPVPGYMLPGPQPVSGAELMEGALRRVVGSRYERNPVARRVCIEHYGATCFVCGFSFEEKYGEIGLGFIHVHHLTPLSAIGDEYEVDPVVDLRPVCPNCHAMLHRKDPPYTIEELQTRMSEAAMRSGGHD